jgi:hypothetical protein
MLKTITQDQDISFYGKINRGEIAWFVIFMGCLPTLALILTIHAILTNPQNLDIFTYTLKGSFIVLILVSVSIFILWVGFLWRWEYVHNGKNAINRFWKRYKKGILPKLFDVRSFNAIDHKNIQSGDSEKILSGMQDYILFHFYENIWHIPVYVLIPQKTFVNIEKITGTSNDSYKIIKNPESVQVHFNNGEKIKLKGDDFEAYLFLDYLFKTQGDRISKLKELLRRLERNEITAMKYVEQMTKKKMKKINSKMSE